MTMMNVTVNTNISTFQTFTRRIFHFLLRICRFVREFFLTICLITNQARKLIKIPNFYSEFFERLQIKLKEI